MNTGMEPHDQDDILKQAYIEFCETWLEGNQPDPEEFCQHRPSCGSTLLVHLREFISNYYCFQEFRKVGKAPFPVKFSEDEAFGDKTFGDFHFLREIGRGGMGVVYEARQVSLDRIVAVKVLPALLTLRPETVARFKREAATAAKLKHPGIVKIHAIGEEKENHFFAMELVKGAPLDKVIERLALKEALPKDGRLMGAAVKEEMHLPTDLVDNEDETGGEVGMLPDFWNKTYIEAACRVCVQVAEALMYAHGAGVIHRDIKPSNILVREDGSCVLTDFGLAREEGLPSLTVTGELAGTPHYIAPEQASPQQAALDHRVDIYSLGVTLYEMLTRIRPFDGRTSQEVLGKIVSKEPSAPRVTNPLIPRDLETICLTAMEKDPDRRYQNASELREDLANFIEYRPIKARPVGLAMRTIRLIRRNPAATTVLGLLFLLIVLGPLVFGIQQKMANIRIRDERNAKEIALKFAEQERNAKEVALKHAEREAATSKRVSDYLVGIFRATNPFMTNGEEITAYELLQQGAAKIDNELEDQPLIQARLRHALGQAYQSLGSFDDAETHLRKAARIFQRELGDEHTLTRSCLLDLSDLFLLQVRLEEAGLLLTKALKNGLAHQEEWDAEESNLVLSIKSNIGRKYVMEGRYEEAEEIYLQVIDEYRRISSDDDSIIIYAMHQLGNLYGSMERLDEAESFLAKSLERSIRTFGEDNFTTIHIINDLGVFYINNSRLQKAESLLLPAFEGYRRILGDDHFMTYLTMGHVATLYSRMSRSKEAELYCRQSLEGLCRIVGEHHPVTLRAVAGLADFYITQGQFDEAESLLVDALEKRQAMAGDHDPDKFNDLDLFDKKASPLHEVESRFIKTLSLVGDPYTQYKQITQWMITQLADLYTQKGKYDEAEALFIKAMEGYPDDQPSKAFIMKCLGMLYFKKGNHKKAESHLLQALEMRRRISTGDNCLLYHLKDNLGIFYKETGRPEQAESFFIEALEGLRRTHGELHFSTITCMDNLTGLYTEQGRLKKAEALTRELIKRTPKGTPEYFMRKLRLFRILEKSGKGKSGELAEHEGQQADWNNPWILTSAHQHVQLLTTVDYDYAQRVLAESEKAYNQTKRVVKFEPELEEHSIVLYLCSNLEEYNDFGEAVGDEKSSSYAVFYAEDFPEGGPISVIHSAGKKEPQMRFTEGLARHAVVEQYLNRINEKGEIPAWFVKGQAIKTERYFHPEYIKWSIREALSPLGGFMALDRLFETFEYTEHEIHMAGLICAYLDCEDSCEKAKTAFEHTLEAIRKKKDISSACRVLEKALMANEENIKAFMAKHEME